MEEFGSANVNVVNILLQAQEFLIMEKKLTVAGAIIKIHLKKKKKNRKNINNIIKQQIVEERYF